MGVKSKRLLEKLYNLDSGYTRLTKSNAKATNELKILGFVILIPISTGGYDVCITRPGVDYVETGVFGR